MTLSMSNLRAFERGYKACAHWSGSFCSFDQGADKTEVVIAESLKSSCPPPMAKHVLVTVRANCLNVIYSVTVTHRAERLAAERPPLP